MHGYSFIVKMHTCTLGTRWVLNLETIPSDQYVLLPPLLLYNPDTHVCRKHSQLSRWIYKRLPHLVEFWFSWGWSRETGLDNLNIHRVRPLGWENWLECDTTNRWAHYSTLDSPGVTNINDGWVWTIIKQQRLLIAVEWRCCEWLLTSVRERIIWCTVSM